MNAGQRLRAGAPGAAAEEWLIDTRRPAPAILPPPLPPGAPPAIAPRASLGWSSGQAPALAAAVAFLAGIGLFSVGRALLPLLPAMRAAASGPVSDARPAARIAPARLKFTNTNELRAAGRRSTTR